MSQLDELKRWVAGALSRPEVIAGDSTVFQKLVDRLDSVDTYDTGSLVRGGGTVGNGGRIVTMGSGNGRAPNKRRGDLFEQMTKRLLQVGGIPISGLLDPIQAGGCALDEIYLFSEIPTDIRQALGLSTRDMGIDLVARIPPHYTKNGVGGWIAIQCKYRKKPRPNPRFRQPFAVPWAELSTFYSLCARTGPWLRHVVVTSADSVSRQGKKNGMDYSVCGARLRGLPRSVWQAFCGYEGHTLVTSPSPPTADVSSTESTSEVSTPSTKVESTARPKVRVRARPKASPAPVPRPPIGAGRTIGQPTTPMTVSINGDSPTTLSPEQADAILALITPPNNGAGGMYTMCAEEAVADGTLVVPPPPAPKKRQVKRSTAQSVSGRKSGPTPKAPDMDKMREARLKHFQGSEPREQ